MKKVTKDLISRKFLNAFNRNSVYEAIFRSFPSNWREMFSAMIYGFNHFCVNFTDIFVNLRFCSFISWFHEIFFYLVNLMKMQSQSVQSENQGNSLLHLTKFREIKFLKSWFDEIFFRWETLYHKTTRSCSEKFMKSTL